MKSDLKKMLVVWAIVSAAAIAGVAAMRVHSVNLINRIQYSHPNMAVVALSYQREAERRYRAATQRLERQIRQGGAHALDPADRDLNTAINLFEKAWEMSPSRPQTLYTLGDLYGMTGNAPQQNYYYGQYYLALRNPEREPSVALAKFREAAAADPGNAFYKIGIARSLYELKDFDEAQANAEEAAQDAEAAAQAHHVLGQIAVARGDAEQGIALFEKAVELDPGFERAIKDLGRRYEATGQRDKLIALYSGALDRLPKDANLRHLLGNAYMDAQEWNKALDAYMDAYKLNPRSVALIGDIIRVHARLGNDASVRYYTNRALDLDPQFVAKKLTEE